MCTRLYVGNLPPRLTERELERSFRKFGALKDVVIKGHYGFVEFADHRDADEAIHRMNDKDIMGQRIRVEASQGARRSRERRNRSRDSRSERNRVRSPMDRDRGHRDMLPLSSYGVMSWGSNGRYTMPLSMTPLWGPAPIGPPRPLLPVEDRFRSRRRKMVGSGTGRRAKRSEKKGRFGGTPVVTRNRVIVQNLSSRVSWQDLKDYMRQAGEVTYAECHNENRHEGMVCFQNETDLQKALDKLDGTELNGRKIRLIDDSSKVAVLKRESSDSKSRSRSLSGSRTRSRSPLSNKSASVNRSRSPSGSQQSASRSRSRSGSRSQSSERSVSRSQSRSLSRSRSPMPEGKRDA